MGKKSAIPSIRTEDQALNRVLDAVKQNIDAITGQARNSQQLAALPETADLAEVIAKVNAIIDCIQ